MLHPQTEKREMVCWLYDKGSRTNTRPHRREWCKVDKEICAREANSMESDASWKTKATPKNKVDNDEDSFTLKLMKEHGIKNVRGGSWCMVNMRQKTYRELEGLIEGKKNLRNVKKKSPLRKTKQNKVIRCNGVKKNGKSCKQIVAKKGDYCKYHSSQKNAQKKVICAKCNRIGHESKDCYAKTKVAGRDPLSRMLRSGLRKK